MNQEQICQFFMENKKRNCKFPIIPNSKFCHYHSLDQDFVICPLEGKHAVLRSRLESHLKVCPKAKFVENISNQLWFEQGANAGLNVKGNNVESIQESIKKKEETKGDEVIPKEYEENEEKKEQNNEKEQKQAEIPKTTINSQKNNKILVELETNNPEYLLELCLKVDLAFEQAIKEYQNVIEPLNQTLLVSSSAKASDISKNQKDDQQLSLMLDLMASYGLLSKKFVYIEYGAGKGHLSHEIAVRNNDESAHILLEKEPRRNKFDKNHRTNPNFHRLRTDILNFNINVLGDVLTEFEKPLKLIGVSKHMCGGATDLSINSLMRLEGEKGILTGLFMVPCCHHLCTLNCYPDPEFLLSLGLKKEEIPIFFKMSSWAVTSLYDEEEKEKKAIGSFKKTEIGFKVKKIVDIGRCLFLYKKTGRKTLLRKYCELNLTPENMAIVMI